MDGRVPLSDALPSGADHFATTHWSLVLAAGDRRDAEADRALERLCRAYWPPLYAYVRRRVSDVHQAQDLTQAFFERLLDKQFLAQAPQTRDYRYWSFMPDGTQGHARGGWSATEQAFVFQSEPKDGKTMTMAVRLISDDQHEWQLTVLDDDGRKYLDMAVATTRKK
jgi:hypothetical protein